MARVDGFQAKCREYPNCTFPVILRSCNVHVVVPSEGSLAGLAADHDVGRFQLCRSYLPLPYQDCLRVPCLQDSRAELQFREVAESLVGADTQVAIWTYRIQGESLVWSNSGIAHG